MNPLVLIGAAPCTHQDYAQLKLLGLPEHDILIVGANVENYEQYDAKYFATYHPECLYAMKKRPFIVISNRQERGMVDVILPLAEKEPTGSSALLGALFGIEEGYDKLILCGCPLQGKSETKKGYPYSAFWKGWQFHFNDVKGKTKSMSGWTAELLGKPTKEWIDK